MIDATPLFQALIALIITIITTFIIPYIKTKTNEEQRAQIASWVKIAVTAAEQLYMGSGRGEEKKNYVTAFLLNHGYTIEEDIIDAMIEAAVYELKAGLAI